MTGCLRFLLRRRLVREPATSLLAVAGVALGTGSVVTVQVLTRGAVAAFDATVELLSGDADAVVLGHGGKLDESLYPVVLGTEGVASASPILTSSVVVRRAGGREAPRRVPLYGVDLLSPTESPLRPPPAADPTRGSTPSDAVSAQRGPTPDPASRPVRPAAVSGELARALSLRAGDSVEVARGSAWDPVVVSGVLEPASPASDPGPLLVMDIAAAQDVLGGVEWISRVNVRFRPEAAAVATGDRLSSRLDGRALVSSPSGQRAEARRLLSGFRVNLSALAFTSVFVGLFLVYSATRTSLSRRRGETGLLRSLGATRSQVLGATLGEAGVLGVVGAALGVPLGYAAALANLESVSGTVTDLYLLSAIRTLEVPLHVWALALAGGVAGTLAGAAGPAVEVCFAPLAELLSERRARVRWRKLSKTLWRASWALLALLLAWFAAGGHRWRPAGFVLAAGIMVWTALAAPRLVVGACRLAGRSRGFGWRFALGGLPVRLHTSGVAVAGVGVAFAMLVGTTVMVGSFRDTFRAWLNTTMQADVYVSAAAWTGATDQGGVERELLDKLRELPGVAGVGPLRGFHGYADDLPVALRGLDFRQDSASAASRSDRLLFLEGDPEAVAAELANGAVAVSEPLARRAGVWRGDSISVRTATGPMRAAVAGVYYQYGSDRGSVSMDLGTMEAWFGPGQPHGVAVYVDRERRRGASRTGREDGREKRASDDGGQRAGVAEAVRQAAAPYPVLVRTNSALRDDALRVFDQTFAVTLLLQAMALAVAAAGVALSLLVMAREEAPDTATFRALGATRGQLFRFHLGKGAGLAGIGGALGTVGGAGLAVILIYVTNRAYFGWTVQFGVPALSLLEQGAALALAAVAASWWPALRAAGGGGMAARRTAVTAAVVVAGLAACSPPESGSGDAPADGPLPLPTSNAEGWLAADPDYPWSFPEDHGPHFGYKTEWWYFTGILSAERSDNSPDDRGDRTREPPAGVRELGYQFTIFKIGLRPPDPGAADDRTGSEVHPGTESVVTSRAIDGAGPPGASDSAAPRASRWAASSLLLGHAALIDPAGRRHVFAEVLYRAGTLDAVGPRPSLPADPGADPALASAPLLAGFGSASAFDPGSAAEIPIAWSRGPPGTSAPWQLVLQNNGFAFEAVDDATGLALSLAVQPTRPVVLQGPNGYSRKSAQPGRASMYYSRPRMATTGTVRLGDARYAVAGTSWMDHEFSSEPLAPEQAGWDWLSLRMNDGADVTAFQLRRSDGRTDYQAATLATDDGPLDGERRLLDVRLARPLAPDEWSMTPGRRWTSPTTGATYPVEWIVTLPIGVGRLVVRAAFPSQENVSSRVANLHYWEGLVRAFGPGGRQVGEGYLEMTGYGKGSRPAL